MINNNAPLKPELVAGAFDAMDDVRKVLNKWGELHIASITIAQMEEVLIDLQRAVCHVAEEAGFSPRKLTWSVHQGLSHIDDHPRRV